MKKLLFLLVLLVPGSWVLAATPEHAYGLVGFREWLDLESEMIAKFGSPAEGKTGAWKVGVGYKSKQFWGVEFSYGRSPSTSTTFKGSIPNGDIVDWTNTLRDNKNWHVTGTAEIQLTGNIFGVAKLGVTHNTYSAVLLPDLGGASGFLAVRQDYSSTDPTYSFGVKYRVREPSGQARPGIDLLLMYTQREDIETHTSAVEFEFRLAFPVQSGRSRRI